MQLSSEFGDEKTNTPVGQDEKNHNDRGVCPGEAGHSPARVPMLPTGDGGCEHRTAGAGVAAQSQGLLGGRRGRKQGQWGWAKMEGSEGRAEDFSL